MHAATVTLAAGAVLLELTLVTSASSATRWVVLNCLGVAGLLPALCWATTRLDPVLVRAARR